MLRCAGFASAHRILLPRAIAALAQRHPDLRVTTRDMEPEDSLPALKLGELDLAIAQEYAFSPMPADPAIERTDLLEDRLRVALPEDHRLATAARSTCALEHEPWIAGREGSFCHLVVIHSTRAAGYEPRLPTSPTTSPSPTRSSPTGRRRPRARTGRAPPPGVVALPVKGAPPSRRIYAAVRAGSSAARRSPRCSQRSPSAEHRVQQPREALVELLAAQPVHERRALGRCSITPLSRSTRKWCARRLGDGQVEGAAAALALGGEARTISSRTGSASACRTPVSSSVSAGG